MTPQSTLIRLRAHVPEQAYEYLVHLITENNIHFKITRPRKTKLGDYRYDPQHKTHQITVNENLNPYAFLVTAVHELAHFIQFKNHQRKRIAPHGIEWKTAFQQLMIPLLQEDVFPSEIRSSLTKHLQNPKASSCADPKLMRLLENYDSNPRTRVEDLPNGTLFQLDGHRVFRKEEKRRTRFRCTDVATNRTWFVHGLAEVKCILAAKNEGHSK